MKQTTPGRDQSLSNLERGLQAVHGVIDGVTPGQWGNSSPWPGWSVRALVEHLIEGNRQTAARLGSFPLAVDESHAVPSPHQPERGPRSAPATTFRISGDQLLATAAGISRDDTVVRALLDERFFDLIVHGWDIAVATGQPPDFAPELQELALVHAHGLLDGKDRTETPFGLPRPIAPDAPAGDRLAAFLGYGWPVSTGPDQP